MLNSMLRQLLYFEVSRLNPFCYLLRVPVDMFVGVVDILVRPHTPNTTS